MNKEFTKDGICNYCMAREVCIKKCDFKLYEELKNEANRLTEVLSRWKKKTK